MFQSQLRSNGYAFDRNVGGASLPKDCGPWRSVAQSMSFSVKQLSPQVQNAIRRHGYYVLLPSDS
jgi:hypothetical protein